MVCLLLWSSAVRVHDSQAYRKVDVMSERINRILEPREIHLSFQTGFHLVNLTNLIYLGCEIIPAQFKKSTASLRNKGVALTAARVQKSKEQHRPASEINSLGLEYCTRQR